MKLGVLATLAGLVIATACGGSPAAAPSATSGAAAATASAAASPAGYSATTLRFKSDGTPDLTGLTVHLGNAAGDATIGDTVVYATVQELKKWGANADLQLGSSNTTQLAVVSGQLQATAGPLPTDLDAGLDIFGNNQVHVDYLMVSSKLSTLSQLKGATIAIATTVSPDNYLLDGALAKAGLKRSDVKIQLTGSNGNSVNQMVQHQVDVAFVHADALAKLQKSGTTNVLANGATLEPWDADSYMTATSAWLKANPATAEAIDLAWLHAAWEFDNDKAQWVKDAVAYTKSAITSAEASSGYDALAKAQPWPADGTGMETASLQKNFDAAKASGQIKGQGDRPIDQWAVMDPWVNAVAYFKTHASAIEK
ncbi:MAG: PhnD/SsuA/transferrin family substrate-binding protein [Chloroflexota bacterium]|nr:PhnD/SsuA/transferrin family substrate-binding protein [Chloroflexota bacterium]MDE3192195.1 PhnD/SsuA/transferrin family substrate-binding protein [Chloroflexota bacterium]